jgi:hypothetical protein
MCFEGQIERQAFRFLRLYNETILFEDAQIEGVHLLDRDALVEVTCERRKKAASDEPRPAPPRS